MGALKCGNSAGWGLCLFLGESGLLYPNGPNTFLSKRTTAQNHNRYKEYMIGKHHIYIYAYIYLSTHVCKYMHTCVYVYIHIHPDVLM